MGGTFTLPVLLVVVACPIKPDYPPPIGGLKFR